MRLIAAMLTIPLAGCEGGRALLGALSQTAAVEERVQETEPTGVIVTPQGEAAVIEQPVIPTNDLCYVRARNFNGLTPMRCEDVARAPRF